MAAASVVLDSLGALGTIEDGCNVGFPDVNVSDMHLPTLMTGRFHRQFSR
jgi:hypothetical protein